MYIDRYGFKCRFKYGDNLGYRYHLNNGRYGSKAAEVPTQREESGSWWLKRRPLKTGGVYHFFNGKITGTWWLASGFCVFSSEKKHILMCGCFIVKHIWIGVQKQGKWSNWPVGDVDDTSGALEKSDNIQVYQPHSEVPRPCYVVEGLSCVTSAELFQNRCRSWLQFKHTCFWNRKMLVSNPFRTVSARIGTILETWLEASWSPSLTYAENQRFWEYKSANTTKTTFSWRSFPCLSKVFLIPHVYHSFVPKYNSWKVDPVGTQFWHIAVCI